MRCNDIQVILKIPVPIDKPDGNGVMYKEDAIKKACDKANGCPITRYDDNGNEIPIGVANKVEYSDGFILIDGISFYGGTNDIIKSLDKDIITSMEITSFGLSE